MAFQSPTQIEEHYRIAKDRYADVDVNTDAALERLAKVSISIPCWQGDDVTGFEGDLDLEGSGIKVTGAYPGRARTPEELRNDFETAHELIPGSHRMNLHAMYADVGEDVDRDELEPAHFQDWVDWAKDQGLGLDLSPTFMAHEKAADGFTLSHLDEGIRDFWIRHGAACRRISRYFGKELGSTSVCGVWIPDGYKDHPADRKRHRDLLRASLDEVLSEDLHPAFSRDSVESKLFGLGSESYVVGSYDFYHGYALENDIMLCVDTGHFHPTEEIADKISALFQHMDELQFHFTRNLRWDSDHVVLYSDEKRDIARELVRGEYLDQSFIGLDFFDATINRVAAWVLGTRSMQKALLFALLEPHEQLREFEQDQAFTSRLALHDLTSVLPFGAVWNYFCLQQDVPAAGGWMKEIRSYEEEVQFQR